MMAVQMQEWRLAGCGADCRPRQHDPISHEAWGYRQATERPAPTVIEADGLRIDMRTQTVTVDGEIVHLSPREWQVLAYLASKPDLWCGYEEIARAVWGEFITRKDCDHLVRININRMRGQLGRARTAILNRPGFGYMLRVDADPPLPITRMRRARPGRKWARNYDACTWCKTTERRHGGRGLCTRCYDHQQKAGKFI